LAFGVSSKNPIQNSLRKALSGDLVETMKAAKILLLAQAILMLADFAFAQTWTQASVPDIDWAGVASSADGSKLVAVAAAEYPSEVAGIYTSADSGTDWTLTGAPTNLWWSSVASSADGCKLVAASNSRYSQYSEGGYGGIYISTNSGINWFQTSAPSGNTNNWISVASSTDGCKLIAVMNGGGIYTSVDSGNDWTLTSAPNTNWASVASSADGTKLAAAVGQFAPEPSLLGGIYTSTNSGIDWTLTSAPSEPWNSIASSADGNKLVAGESSFESEDLEIYYSTNSGVGWSRTFGIQAGGGPISVASSADGSKMVAAGDGIYTWPWPLKFPRGRIGWQLQTNAPWYPAWTSIALSADGNKLVAVAPPAGALGGIWTSQSTPSPRLNIAPINCNLAFSWIIPSTNFVLQQSCDLISWVTLTNVPTLNLTSLQNQTTLSPTNSIGFYRLSTP
jgi:hypothetical protein